MIRSKYGGWIQAKARLRREEEARHSATLSPAAAPPSLPPARDEAGAAAWPTTESARAISDAAHQRAEAHARAAGGLNRSLLPHEQASSPPAHAQAVLQLETPWAQPLQPTYQQQQPPARPMGGTAADEVLAFGTGSNPDDGGSGSTLDRSGGSHSPAAPARGLAISAGRSPVHHGANGPVTHDRGAAPVGSSLGPAATSPPASRQVARQASSRRLGMGGLSPGDRQDSGLSSPVSPAPGAVRPRQAGASDTSDDEFDDLDEFDLGGGLGAASLGIAPPKKRTDAPGASRAAAGLGFGFVGAPRAAVIPATAARPKSRATPVSTFAVDDSELDDDF